MADDRVRASYDAVAAAYDAALHDELAGKPLDRAMLQAFLELAGPSGVIADVGCGPGHITAHLTAAGRRTVAGLDLSAGMVAAARRRHPGLPVLAASMTALPVRAGALAGAVACYSVIHLGPAGRATAFRELARTVRPGGPVLVSFHVADADLPAGGTRRLRSLLGAAVDLDFHFLDPAVVAAELAAAGFAPVATMVREPGPAAEYPSRRACLLTRRVE